MVQVQQDRFHAYSREGLALALEILAGPEAWAELATGQPTVQPGSAGTRTGALSIVAADGRGIVLEDSGDVTYTVVSIHGRQDARISSEVC